MRITLAFLAFASLFAQTTVPISGRITNAVTGLPIGSAIIKLRPNASDARWDTHYADANGNYSIDEAPAGTDEIDITAEGYVAFHKTNPADTFIRISAEHLRYDLQLMPAASIRGRIIDRDPGGKDQFLVTLQWEDFTGGVAHFAGAFTDEHAMQMSSTLRADGSFRFEGLDPGRYLVRAAPVKSDRTVRDGIAPVASGTEDNVVTYYPGVGEVAEAELIALKPGDTRTVEFRMSKRPLFRAAGEVEFPDASGGIIHINMIRENGGSDESHASFSKAGPFTIGGLRPGQYTAIAIVDPSGETGRAPFIVTDHDVTGLRIAPHPVEQVTVSGTFRMANNGTPLPKDLSLLYSDPAPGGRSEPAPVADDGQFLLTDYPGDYSVQPVVPSDNAVTEIRYGGRNYLNSFLPLGKYADTSLVIVLSDRPGLAGGSLVDKDRKPIAATISLVPDPIPSELDFRTIRVAKTDAAGNFAFNGVAPGKYKAVALTGDDRKRDHDMALLGDKLRLADSIEVKAGQAATINVRP